MSTRVGMVSLGCPKNQVDAEIMLHGLKRYGFELTNAVDEADVVVINTCGFIESAKQESIENILEFCQLKAEGAIELVVVTGCLAERYKDEIAQEIPEADVIVGLGSEADLANSITKALKGERVVRFDAKENLALNGERILTTQPFTAYLKIAEGCNNRCTFCAIPMIRGKYRSRTMEDIVDEARNLADGGVKELILVAQDTSYYGKDLYGEFKLPVLLKRLVDIKGLQWIRILYCYPERITDELLDVIAREEKIVKYLDIPLQHINSRILKDMARQITNQEILALLKRIRSKVPKMVIRTTLIAGFPGESKKEFEELVSFVKDAKFERLGCFAYSIEEGTKAAEMPYQIDEAEKLRRAELVTLEQMVIMAEQAQMQIGSTVEILIEGYDEEGACYYGRSYADAPDIDTQVYFTSETDMRVGEFTDVQITGTLDCDLIGEQKER